jgi:hypothetical protein
MFAMEDALIRISRGRLGAARALKGFPVNPSSKFSLRQKTEKPLLS